MPYIQVDLKEGLSEPEKAALTLEIREKVHAAIGSPREFINVVLREWPDVNFRVAGAVPETGVMTAVDA